MPATPAWPPKSLPRLFVEATLAAGARGRAGRGRRPIISAMSCARVRAPRCWCSTGAAGEWLARVAEAGKKRMTLTVELRTREPETLPDLILAFAPVKRAQTDWLVEKATELGVADAPAGDDPADGGRAGQARAAALHRDRGGRAMRADDPSRTSPSRWRSIASLASGSPRGALYFADEQGGERGRSGHVARARRRS